MIRYIKGIVTSVSEDAVIVEAGGIGYECLCGASDLGCFAAQIGKNATVYTYLSHKEDSMMLYGFSSEENRSGFLTLLKTDGIGPKMALKILSAYSMSQIQAYIEAEDLSALKRSPVSVQKQLASSFLISKARLSCLSRQHHSRPALSEILCLH